MRYLHRIAGHFYFRARVPKDLHTILNCREIKRAIKTKYLKSAIKIVEVLTYEVDRAFSLIRSSIMTDEQIRKFLKEFVDTSLNKLENERIDNPLNPQEHKKQIDSYNSIVHHFENRLGTINTRNSEVLLNELLKNKDMKVDKQSSDYRKLRVEFAKAELEVNKIYRERLKGNYNNDYDKFLSNLLPQNSTSHKANKLLSEVIAEYIKEKTIQKEWNDKNRAETVPFYKQFLEIMGDRDIKDYDKNDFQHFAEIMVKFPKNMRKKQETRDLPLNEIITLISSGQLSDYEPISISTVNKNFVRVNALFGYAQKHGYITVNFAEGMKIKKKKKADEEREPYSVEDLKKLFSSPVYQEVSMKYPERFWIPLIALYSGCRIGEICQLYKTDIKVVDGIPCLDLNDKEDKALKTMVSSRIVPISPVLLKIGFMDYVESVSHERLWSNLSKGRDGYGHLFTRWSYRYNRKYVTQHPKRVMHSLRHNFIDNLKQKKTIPETLIKEIVGHSVESMTFGRYGKGYSIRDKFEAIKKLNYGINLSHLKFPIKKG